MTFQESHQQQSSGNSFKLNGINIQMQKIKS
jgi:hypothetical protein